jgi:hypothetical protein
MSSEEGEVAHAGPVIRVPLAAGISIGIAVAFTLVVGLVPSPVVDFARDAVPVVPRPRTGQRRPLGRRRPAPCFHDSGGDG